MKNVAKASICFFFKKKINNKIMLKSVCYCQCCPFVNIMSVPYSRLKCVTLLYTIYKWYISYMLFTKSLDCRQFFLNPFCSSIYIYLYGSILNICICILNAFWKHVAFIRFYRQYHNKKVNKWQKNDAILFTVKFIVSPIAPLK